MNKTQRDGIRTYAESMKNGSPWSLSNACIKALDEVDRLRAAIEKHRETCLEPPAFMCDHDVELWSVLGEEVTR